MFCMETGIRQRWFCHQYFIFFIFPHTIFLMEPYGLMGTLMICSVCHFQPMLLRSTSRYKVNCTRYSMMIQPPTNGLSSGPMVRKFYALGFPTSPWDNGTPPLSRLPSAAARAALLRRLHRTGRRRSSTPRADGQPAPPPATLPHGSSTLRTATLLLLLYAPPSSSPERKLCNISKSIFQHFVLPFSTFHLCSFNILNVKC